VPPDGGRGTAHRALQRHRASNGSLDLAATSRSEFISSTNSIPTITTSLRQTMMYIKVKRMVYLLDRSGFELGGILAQHRGFLNLPQCSCRCKVTTDIPSPKTARSWLARFSAASITNTVGKRSLREARIAQMTAAPALHWGYSRPLETRWHTTPNVTPESARGQRKEESFNLLCGSGGLRELRRGELGKNSLVPICTEFISTAVSNPTIAGGSSQATMHIYSVKRLVCRFADRIGQLRS